MTVGGACYVFRPSTIEGVLEAMEAARKAGCTVALKGGGNSYGDAFLNREQVVLDLSRMRRILSWNPNTGVIQCEPGVTIEDGWWPPVVSGTAHITLGGALAANIHGKNNRKAGPIGEHVKEFSLLTANGEERTIAPLEDHDLFYAVIGGFGALGVITSVTLQLKRVHSGLLDVETHVARNWAEALDKAERLAEQWDYAVGWVDGFPSGANAGRSVLHSARYLDAGEDPHPEETLRAEAQQIPDSIFGIPKRALPRLMRPLTRPLGLRFINAMKFRAGTREAGHRFRQSLVAFNFLLDSIPNWKRAYRPAALLQYQIFAPINAAQQVFTEATRVAKEQGFPPFLCVLKRHRPDPFLLSHAVDGFSLAMDFRVHMRRWEAFRRLADEMTELTLSAGGRFYLAKDSVLRRGQFRQAVGEEALERFLALKARVDPEGLFWSELWGRVVGEPTFHGRPAEPSC
ncbi:MAG: FAD-binding protein [Armatimonadota bacterium]